MISDLEAANYSHTPFLPLRDAVLFPHTSTDLVVGRQRSLRSITESQRDNRPIIVSLQKLPEIEVPRLDEVHTVGVVATIIKVVKQSADTHRLTLEGHHRVAIDQMHDYGFLNVDASYFPSNRKPLRDITDNEKAELLKIIQQLVLFNRIPDSEQLVSELYAHDNYEKLLNIISSKINISIEQKQDLLSLAGNYDKYKKLVSLFSSAVEVEKVESKVKQRMLSQIEKSQKDFYIQEQIKALQRELGEESQEKKEIKEFEDSAKAIGMTKEALEKTTSEVDRLRSMPPSSPEVSVIKTYIQHLLALPWKKRSAVSSNIEKAKKILNEDHYALADIKDRVLEFLAVQKRTKKVSASILCFVGPPGVGKTSLARSIARATNRKFAKISLGGVRDEAEIRGHRRTYIGSLPGKILSNIVKTQVKNPVFLLDEIDKLGSDFRGDPASALLEVLDPEQNANFVDHYTEVAFDLSEVLFITTANSYSMPKPLLDRLEVIPVSGYSDHEKFHIAQNHLIPKQKLQHGIKKDDFTIQKKAIYEIICFYTRESGVRQLERAIAKICRKFVYHADISNKKVSAKKTSDETVLSDIKKYLGIRLYRHQQDKPESIVGQVTGLAWTEHGGEILNIEAITTSGKGNKHYTGSLGMVMKESIDAALTIIKKHAMTFDPTISDKYFSEHDFHIHVPEGTIPKDGPSAGIGMTIALFSAILNVPVLTSVATTGEVTLRGSILPIGGLREKLLAAQRAQIKKVLIPAENAPQLEEIPDDIKKGLEIIPIEWLEESFIHLLNIETNKIKIFANSVINFRNEHSHATNKPQIHH